MKKYIFAYTEHGIGIHNPIKAETQTEAEQKLNLYFHEDGYFPTDVKLITVEDLPVFLISHKELHAAAANTDGAVLKLTDPAEPGNPFGYDLNLSEMLVFSFQPYTDDIINQVDFKDDTIMEMHMVRDLGNGGGIYPLNADARNEWLQLFKWNARNARNAPAKNDEVRYKFLKHTINHTNGDLWTVVTDHAPGGLGAAEGKGGYNHLGNFSSFSAAARMATLSYMAMNPDAFYSNILHRAAGYRGRYHEWSVLQQAVKRDGLHVPAWLCRSTDLNMMITVAGKEV